MSNLDLIKKAIAADDFLSESEWTLASHTGEGSNAVFWDTESMNDMDKHYSVGLQVRVTNNEQVMGKFYLNARGIGFTRIESMEFCLPNRNLHSAWMLLESIGTILDKEFSEYGDYNVSAGLITLAKKRAERSAWIEQYMIQVLKNLPDEKEARKLARAEWRKMKGEE